MGEKEKQWRESQKHNTNFSIIIPMKNEEKYILDALNSIKEQDYANYEVFVIDDHSQDKSQEIVKKFQQENQNMKLNIDTVPDDKWGPGVARNIGLEQANGEYIMFLDADDELIPDVLKNINKAIKNNDQMEVFLLGQISHLIGECKSKAKGKIYKNEKLSKLVGKLRKQKESVKEERKETIGHKVEERPDVLLLGHDMHLLNAEGKLKKIMKFRPKPFQGTKLFQMGINTGGTIWQGCWKKSLFAENHIRFDENCIFEDVATRIQLYGRAQNISVPSIVGYKYNQRQGESITTKQTSYHMRQATAMGKRIERLVEEGKVDPKYQKYINIRKATMLGTLAWVAYCMGEYKIYQAKQKRKEKQQKNNENINRSK